MIVLPRTEQLPARSVTKAILLKLLRDVCRLYLLLVDLECDQESVSFASGVSRY